MCLLHTHHADTIISDAWIKDFYSTNPDGIGVMYSEKDDEGVPQLVIKKFIARTAKDAVKFYTDNIKGREALVHWRMATHGDVDHANCHPYEVVPIESGHGIYMMHNGILSEGNYMDKSKSDTWHYIQNYIKPLLDPALGGNPQLAYKKAFEYILGEAIGSGNRFALMDNEGRTVICNESTGVYWNGMWMSNTYAWSAPSRLTARGVWSSGGKTFAQGKDNKYYDAAQGLQQPEYMEEPDDWYQTYKGGTTTGKYQVPYKANTNSVTNGTKTVVVATDGTGKVLTTLKSGASKRLGKRGRKNARVDGIAKLEDNLNSTLGGNTFGKVSNLTDFELDAAEEAFKTMDGENMTEAYCTLSYQDMYTFMKATDVDQFWECLFMGIDKTITQEQLIEYIQKPELWTAKRPEINPRSRINVGSGEDLPIKGNLTQSEMDDLNHELAFDDEDDDDGERGFMTNGLAMPTEDQVIQATLPRRLLDNASAHFESVFPTNPLTKPATVTSITTAATHSAVLDQQTSGQTAATYVPDQRFNAV